MQMSLVFPEVKADKNDDHDPKCGRAVRDNYLKLQELVLKAARLEKIIEVWRVKFRRFHCL
jgi:hypothetical protein